MQWHQHQYQQQQEQQQQSAICSGVMLEPDDSVLLVLFLSGTSGVDRSPS
uniref:Uncharacterized protein n=1 Tax=Anguilla anguilla TaxID=7936 RepID=A0A0E9X9R1_ANGAN